MKRVSLLFFLICASRFHALAQPDLQQTLQPFETWEQNYIKAHKIKTRTAFYHFGKRPEYKSEVISYDKQGRTTDRLSYEDKGDLKEEFHYTYDSKGRLTSIKSKEGSDHSLDLAITYGKKGGIVNITGTCDGRPAAWDAKINTLKLECAYTRNAQYTFDKAGRVIKTESDKRDPDNRDDVGTTVYMYNEKGLLAEKDFKGKYPDHLNQNYKFTYNDEGLVTVVKYDMKEDFSTYNEETRYEYEKSLLMGKKILEYGDAELSRVAYIWDKAGELIGMNEIVSEETGESMYDQFRFEYSR